MLMEPHHEDQCWKVQKILQCSNKEVADEKRSIFFKVQYFDDNKSWMPMDVLRMDDPYLIIDFALKYDMDSKPGFEWVPTYLEADQEHFQILQALNTSKKSKQYKFGVEVPRNPSHALVLDEQDGNNEWRESIKAEIDQIKEYEVFRVIPDGAPTRTGYKQIPYHMVHDVKFDGRKKSRLVAGGHKGPEVHKEDKYSTVVSMEAVRVGFVMAKINDLQVCAGDIVNAYLNAYTNEKLYIIAGPEFGPELAGKRLIIDKSLHGLQSSGARFHELTTTYFVKLDFVPSEADPDLLIRQHPDGHYEYIARFVDDVIAFAKDPLTIMTEMQNTFTMKGVGKPRYYLGGDVLELDEQ